MNSSTSLPRTKSDQLVETLEAAYKSPVSSEATGASEGGGTLSRRSSRQRLLIGASPGCSGSASGSSSSRKSTQNRKSRSAQLKPELDHEVLSSGVALSRASSASLGLSYSFTGFTIPPDEIADSKPCSDDDDDMPEDIESGTKERTKFQTESTLPIHLKAKDWRIYLAIPRLQVHRNMASMVSG